MKPWLRKIPPVFNLILLTAFLTLSGSACTYLSKTTNLVHRLGMRDGGTGEGLRKKIAVAPLANLTEEPGIQSLEPVASSLEKALSTAFSEMEFVHAQATTGPAFLVNLPKKASGALDNLALVKEARNQGFNLVLIPSLISVHHEKIKSWWDWMTPEEDRLMASLRMEVYDTRTGAKIFHDNFQKEKDIRTLNAEKLKLSEILVLDGFADLTQHLTRAVAKKMRREIQAVPWYGFVVSTEGKAGILSAGSNAGLREGRELSLAVDRAALTGYDKLQYYQPGPVVDRVKVVEVNPDQAKVVSLSENPVLPGAVVQALSSGK